MDISKATIALGKYLASKVTNGVGDLAKKVKRTIDEGRALGKDFTDMVQKDLEAVKDFDGTDDDVKKLDQFNSFKYLRNLRSDLTGQKKYPVLDENGKQAVDKSGNPIMTTRKPEEDLILNRRSRGTLLILAIVALSFSPVGPFLLLGVIGLRAGITMRKSIKNAMKSLRAAFGDKQTPVKTGPPSIDNGTAPTSAIQGPRIQNAANPAPQPPVNANTQTSLGQNNALRSTFADAAQKLAAGSKTAPGLGQPIPVQASRGKPVAPKLRA